jgi:hypothetical protein
MMLFETEVRLYQGVIEVRGNRPIFHQPLSSMPEENSVYRVALRGAEILTSPKWNKGTAFTPEERKAFGLRGRLPYQTDSLDQQCDRCMNTSSSVSINSKC